MTPSDHYERYRARLLTQKFNEEVMPAFFSLLKNQDKSMDEELKQKLMKTFDMVCVTIEILCFC